MTLWKVKYLNFLFQVRHNVEEYHERWYNEAVEIAQVVDVQPSMPRIVRRQTLRQNAPAENVKDHYRLNVTVPFLDQILMELESRLLIMLLAITMSIVDTFLISITESNSIGPVIFFLFVIYTYYHYLSIDLLLTDSLMNTEMHFRECHSCLHNLVRTFIWNNTLMICPQLQT